MPIYEYQCDRCNEAFEIFHKIDDDGEVACPKCLGPVRKLISAPNFVLKGAGFYVNDYPSESRREGKRKEKEAPKETAAKEASKEGSEKASGKGEEKRADKKAVKS